MTKLHRVLFALFILSVSVVTFGMGLSSGNPYLMAFPLLIPMGIFAVSKPETLFLSGIALWQSSLVLPGFPNELQLYHLLLLCASLVTGLRMVITKESFQSDQILRILTGFYGFVTFYTMLVRGFGFNVLGTDEIGGMRYVMIFVGVLSVWFLPNLTVTRKQLIRVLYFYAALGFLPVLAELTFILSGGAIYHQYYFVKIGASLGHSFVSSMVGEGVRYTTAGALGRGLLLLPFILFPFKPKFFFAYGAFIVSAIIALSFTGYRSSLAEAGMVIFLTLFFLFRTHRKEYLLASGCAAVLLYFLALIFYDILPYGFQRVLSFLPGVKHFSAASVDAFASTDFRMGVWQLGLQEVPDYLWLGKGLTYSFSEYMALQTFRLPGSHYEIGLISNLHNGPLEALVYLGLPGFLLFTAFSIRIYQLTIRILSKRNVSDKLDPVAVFLSSMILIRILMWWLSFGNPHNSFLH
ncbi:MAG: O-antigen ligase family protein, partial [Kiritimatiellae bacterium]|nr:O-antigen ligase family protein [Kiritimatiellia bacterium]